MNKAQEILLHYNDKQKSISLNKKQSRKSVKKSSENIPSNSKESLDPTILDKRSNDQLEFKIMSVSDNEIILRNKEKFLNVMQEITNQMNKKISQISCSKREIQANSSEKINENIHFYSNIDHVNMRSDERISKNVSIIEEQKIEKDQGVNNDFKNDGVSDLKKENLKISIKNESKENEIKIKNNTIENKENCKNSKKCICTCLII